MAGRRPGRTHRAGAPHRRQGQHRDRLHCHEPDRSPGRARAAPGSRARPLGHRKPAALRPRRVDGRRSLSSPRRRPLAGRAPQSRPVPHPIPRPVRARGARKLPRRPRRGHRRRDRADSLNGPVFTSCVIVRFVFQVLRNPPSSGDFGSGEAARGGFVSPNDLRGKLRDGLRSWQSQG